MVQVSCPGVYVVEVPSGVHTITGVSTSIAAFLGRTSTGPLNKAVRLQNPSDFTRTFGPPHPKSDLAQSVKMFFENGGTDCYVVRLARDAQQADVTLKDVKNREVLVATALSHGTPGNSVRLEVTYNTPRPDETFHLAVIQEDGDKEAARETYLNLSMDPASPRFAPDFVTQQSDLIKVELHKKAGPGGAHDLSDLAKSFAGYSQSRPFVVDPSSALTAFRTAFEKILKDTPRLQMSLDDRPAVALDLTSVLGPTSPAIAEGSAWTPADMALRIQTVVNTQLNAADPALKILCQLKASASGDTVAFRFASDTADKKSVRISRGNTKDFTAPMLLGLDQGGLEPVRYSDFRPVPTAAYFADLEKVVELGELTCGDITSLKIDTEAAITITLTGSTLLSTDPWTKDEGGGNDGIREKLRRIAKAVNEAPNSNWRAEVWGYHLALLAREGGINTLASAVVSATSTLLGGGNFVRNVRRYTLGPTGASSFQLTGAEGKDGNAPTEAEYEGSGDDQTGLHALDPVDLFNLMILPGDEDLPDAAYLNIIGPASIFCESRRAFLLVDPPRSWTRNGRPQVKADTSLIDKVRSRVVKDHSAVFFPRLKYSDRGRVRSIGPSGAIAGLMARIDSSRGVWKAPAGVEADIRNLVDLDVPLTDAENGILNKLGVNCIRQFPNGRVSWGARTLDGSDDFGSEYKYIPIRRLALFLGESLFRGSKPYVFEPNDEPLWAKIRLNVRAFMMSLFRQGAFQGTTPDKAFYVKCDAETTPQNDRNLGIVNIEVGFSPLKPAEFVVIKIQQMIGDLK